MKKTFTPEYIQQNRGCYDKEKATKMSFMSKKEIHILDVLKSEIPLKDKGWFLLKKCDLTLDQKKQLSYDLALIVLPIYEKKHPEDKRVRLCLEAVVKFKNGEISRDDLLTARRNAAYDAAAYAAAAYAAYAYAAAAYAAAAYVAYAYDAAAYDAAAYDAAAYAAAAYADKDLVLNCMIDFVNDQS